MSLCDIFPDDPSCATPEPEPQPEPEQPDEDDIEEEEVDEEVADEEAEEGGEEDADATALAEVNKQLEGWDATARFIELTHYATIKTTTAQIVYLASGIVVSGWTALQLFRYTARKDYWKTARVGDKTNYNELPDTIINYGALVIMLVAAITQMASMFGSLVDLNMQVWWYGVFTGIPILHFTAYWLSVFAYDQGHGSNDVNAGSTQTFALGAIRSNLANGAFLFFALLSNYEGWFAAQWLGMSDESQETMI